ncbi:hypothetical protein MMC11_004552 [Xylographa trunciseda]|nr:hypothetical protein [Xylographa trunciseda]
MYTISAFLVPALLASTAFASPLGKRITNHNHAADPLGDNAAIITQLEQAPTAVTRQALLTDPADWLFDFQNAGPDSITMGAGGKTVKADRKEFPALIGTGVSMTLGFLGPCGFNTPHVHPRSSEINVVVQGALVAEFIAENGVAPVTNTLTQYQMTVFPQGALHTEFNPLCTPSVFVAGFASEDPGVQQAAQSFFGLDGAIVRAALGGEGMVDGVDIEAFRALVPENVALGVESCLAACGIAKRGVE